MRPSVRMDTEHSDRGGPAPEEGRSAEPNIDESAGLDRIREILFGTTQRELERRVLRVDTQSNTRLIELEQETRRRLEMLEAHVKRETETVVGHLERELSATSETLRKLAREHREALGEVEDKLARVEEAASSEQRELRHQLLEQAKTYLDELQRVRKDLMSSIQEQIGLDEEDRGAAYEPEGQRH
jgi:hypothetical protein